jgi:hypothetical protein
MSHSANTYDMHIATVSILLMHVICTLQSCPFLSIYLICISQAFPFMLHICTYTVHCTHIIYWKYMLLSSALCAIESLKRAHWSYISFTELSVVALPINDGLQLPWQGLHEVHQVLQHLAWGHGARWYLIQNSFKMWFFTHIFFYYLFLGLITLHMNIFIYNNLPRVGVHTLV